MTDLPPFVLPLAIAVVAAILVVVLAVLVVRSARRGRRARARARAERARAVAALVLVEDTLVDLDIDLTLSGVLQESAAPPSVRRSRMTAQHARDDSYAELRAVPPGALPVDIRRASRQVLATTAGALEAVKAARRDHDAWVRANAEPTDVIAAARVRLAEARASLGDPQTLLAELARFDETERRDAVEAGADALRAADEAEARLDEAEEMLTIPSRYARPALEAAERAIRRSVAGERTLEEMHRLVLDAAQAVAGEIAAARQAVVDAGAAARALPPREAEQLGVDLAAVTAELDRLKTKAGRRPTATVRAVAGLRETIDRAAGAGLTTQERIRGARTALPGTLASARLSIARAEARLRTTEGVASRMILTEAQRELAIARNADDVLLALAAGRTALSEADRAVSLLAPDEEPDA